GYDSSTDGPVMDHLIQERARELFLEGHRHYDMLRFDLPFPSGAHPWNGRTYRGTTCFPIPSVEEDNNPNVSGS
ncbi:MAG: RagB/SusD family nutrient uptake outer membrane protein, partial [Gemmatimonadetes bacterium]|nr:RagB/SusD family nutrient uptake outer membrane protein [Gemmatimonadota bacterium]NIR78914.1 RagB/SusD family nutrient uptake outer membrane protein [Gemmatimonadota bacterium]NIT87549.1 RagB/SusD family nutrient uptake outer membrane protein [Gemmatimonadota bacterium]NIU31417.1 RagB/SusD family nutrient uptake outer membrane protein [Gemmatimonadota bacterium]NIU36102.1 RagB/SusD family nutrient uptake outer membrane protein [Gemmatimonadota bacterium]